MRKRQDILGMADEDFDRLIHMTLRMRGLLMPISIEDVAQAEAEIESNDIQLPESLRDPLSFLNSSRQKENVLRFPRPEEGSVEQEVTESLARAAREGGDIPAEIQERMRKDRQDAERDGEN